MFKKNQRIFEKKFVYVYKLIIYFNNENEHE